MARDRRPSTHTVEQDISMVRVMEAYQASGLTLHELGLKMGYSERQARKATWQFLHTTYDPRVSMVRKFAAAVGVSISTLVGDNPSPTDHPPARTETRPLVPEVPTA